MSEDEKGKRSPMPRVFEVKSVDDLMSLMKMLGVDPSQQVRPRATDLPTNGWIELDGGPTLPTETAVAGALTALHQCAHDLLVAGGVVPTEKETGALVAKLLSRGLKTYLKDGPPSQEERDAFNEEWETQANILAPPDPDCPCPRCVRARSR